MGQAWENFGHSEHGEVQLKALFLTILLCLLAAPVRADVQGHAEYETARRVLLLNSYHRGNPWSDDIEQGIRDRFATAGRDVELSVEYFDTRRFVDDEQLENMSAYLGVKYLQYPFDLVMVSDNAAFDFAMEHRTGLFPGVPVVFCGVNGFRSSLLKGNRDVSGVVEELDIEANVDTALKIHPGTTTLAFIISTGDVTSRRIAEFEQSALYGELQKRFRLVVLKDASLEEIRRELSRLPLKSVLFLMGGPRNTGPGRPLNQMEIAKEVASMSPVPVYAFWDFQLGSGVLGGRILSGIDQGREAAQIALRILDGAPADSIPIRFQSPATPTFDFKVMQRFGLGVHSLPPGSRIINRPVTVWTQYRRQILGVAAVILLETALIFALMRAMRQRRRALKTLENERMLLESRVSERTEEIRSQREQLAEALLMRNLLLDNALVVIALVRNRRFVWISNHAFELLGYGPGEVLGRSTAFVYYYPEDYQRLWREGEDIIRGGGTYRGDYCFRRKDGQPLWCTMSARALDPDDLEKGVLFVVLDINERKLMEQALRETKANLELLSSTDQLTDLANRRKLTNALGDEIGRARRYGQIFSVIILDLDHFKQINDTYGHDIGDFVLRKVARILTLTLRATDLPGRWGGEEFMLICPGTDQDAAKALAELVRKRIGQHDFTLPRPVTASLGVAEYVEGMDIESLVKRADEALYRAKERGRDRVEAGPDGDREVTADRW